MLFADSEFNRLTRGYALALLLVAGVHGLGWWWSQQRRVVEVTPAVVPQMVDVELLASASPEASPEPPAATPPTPPKAAPRPPEPKAKPVVKPPPKKVEPKPQAKPAQKTNDEVDDLAQRLKHLRETLGSEPAPAKSSAAQSKAAPAKASGGSAASSAKATTARADHLHNPRPPYPAVARARNWEGVTQLRVYVLANGSAGQVQLAGSSGHDVLDNAALAAVRQWRFVPAKRGDQAMASWVQFPIVWKLK